MIDLTLFTGDYRQRGPRNEKISTPFSAGDYTYATNGHMCVRVERQREVTREDGPADQIEQLMLKAFRADEALTDAPSAEVLAEIDTEIAQLSDECFVQLKYLKSIAGLPGARIDIGSQSVAETPIRFIFDGGEGLLMPLRMPLFEREYLALDLRAKEAA